jgi:hypothetical protein
VQHTYSRLPRNPRPARDSDLVSTLKAREVKRSCFPHAGSRKQDARKIDEATTKANSSRSVPTRSTSEQTNSSARLPESTAPTEGRLTSAEASAFGSFNRSDNSRAGFQQPGMSLRLSNAFVFDVAASRLGLTTVAPVTEAETETATGDSDVSSFHEPQPTVISDHRRLASSRH